MTMSTNKFSKAERPFVIDCVFVSIASAIVTLITCAIAPAQPVPALLLHKVVKPLRGYQPGDGPVYSEDPILV
jgi:hypothetical protein